MFSAFKKLTGNKAENGITNNTNSHQAMSYNLQKKFAKGVQYNMKIIIRGDRSTGKTCLFHRLQGKKFVEEYQPTNEIQVASIQWNYKNADDVVKVEVWDVVDKGKKRPSPEGLKLLDEVSPALDAEFIDVYKGTHGVILVMDVTKNWTFSYIQKEIEKIPDDIPVLVLGNHCDMAHHRTVMADVVQFYIDSIQRFIDNLSKKRRQVAENTGAGCNKSQSCHNLSKPSMSIILGKGTPIDKCTSLNNINPSTCQSSSVVNTATEDIAAQAVTSVEEFIPDEGFLDSNFLEESATGIVKGHDDPLGDSESDGENCGNPLVAEYLDDIDCIDTHSEKASISQDIETINSTPENITQWLTGVSISGGRESPEGGEDSGCTDSLYVGLNTDSEKKKKSKKKSKEKVATSKGEKKKKRKKSQEDVDLLKFLSTRNDSYETL